MDVLRTPDERFNDLPGYGWSPRYVEVDGLRMHYVDEGPADGQPVLLLHGEPSWSYLYRTMIPVIASAGCRAIAPDLIGFGRSDKPARIEDYTYERHVGWVRRFIEALDLRGLTLFGQDWGSLIGLRLAAEDEDRFARIVIGNGGLLTGDQQMPEVWHLFKKHVLEAPELKIGSLVASGCVTRLSAETKAAYEAPFPSEAFKAGVRSFPTLIPLTPDDPAAEACRTAMKVLTSSTKPFLTVFGDSDPITRGAERRLQDLIPGAKGQPHEIIEGAGHFLQEDKGEEVARKIVGWLAQT